MKNIPCIISLIFLSGINTQCNKNNTTEQTRSFYMGVTPWPADFTQQELNASYDFVNTHCDIISHHFDEGIPYEEAYNNSGWPAGLVNEVNARTTKTNAAVKILLSSSALDLTRKNKASYSRFSETVSSAVKTRWAQVPLNSDSLVTAYVNYIVYLANELHPAFINYAVESNEASWDASAFMLYKDFISKVFQRLKIIFPSTPLMVSFMVTEMPSSLSLARQLLPYTDYVALSAYPYVHVSSSAGGNTDPSLFPVDFFTRFIDLDINKPFCFAETGYIAENLSVPSFSLNKQGDPQWQNKYLQLVCELTNSRKGKFVIWFCRKDYDAGNNTLRSLGQYQDIFALWEDTGLTDENNNQRPAYNTWLEWMKRKRTN